MALPFVLLGLAAGAALAHENAKKYHERLDLRRSAGEVPSHRIDGINVYNPRVYMKDVVPGSIVCCEVYNELDHTGIWISKDIIVELSNSGLVRAVSAERFINGSSGSSVFIATDKTGNAIVIDKLAEVALESVYDYRKYKLLKYNCHTFMAECITKSLNSSDKSNNKNNDIIYFKDLNKVIQSAANEHVYWDKLAL